MAKRLMHDNRVKSKKVISEPDGPWGGAELRSLSPEPDTKLTLRDDRYMVSVSRGLPIYFVAFAYNHCAYPRRDG